MKTLVLLSGGIDSALTATLARDEGDISLLHIDHGNNGFEWEFAKKIARWFDRNVGYTLIKLPGSTDPNKTNFIPFRNQVLLSVGFASAVAKGCDHVAIGANFDDYNDYPDCRLEWFNRFEYLSSIYASIKIYAPLLRMNKQEVIAYAQHKGIPFDKTFSCYTPVMSPTVSPLACGTCNACKLRLYSFAGLDIADPIEYVQS